MNTKKTAVMYRTLIREALRLTWQRKSLWFFGIFAGFVSTGGLFDLAITGSDRLKTDGTLVQQIIDTVFTGYVWIAFYLSRIHQATIHPTGVFVSIILIIIGLTFLAVLSQTALVHGIKAPLHEHPNIIRKRAHDHLLRIFGLDLLTKISIALFMCLSAGVSIYVIRFGLQNPFLSLLQTLVFLFCILAVNTVSMLSVIHLIETESTSMDAIKFSIRLFKRHWLAVIEFSVILFGLMSLYLFLSIGFMIILSVPYALLYTSTLLSGSLLLFYVSMMLYGIFFIFCIALFAGSLITFQYSAWYLFSQKLGEPSLLTKPFAKLLHLFQR